MVRTEDAGWLTRSTGASALAEVAEELASNPEAVRAKIAEHRPRRAFDLLADPKCVRVGYEALLRALKRTEKGTAHPAQLTAQRKRR